MLKKYILPLVITAAIAISPILANAAPNYGGSIFNSAPNTGTGGGSSVTFPASGDLVVSNGTSSPAGVAPVNGDCLLGSAGVWIAGSCSGAGVSITSLSPGLVFSPNPLTGTGTLTETAAISSTCGSSTSCTILSTDMGMIVRNSSASAMAVSLPQCNSGSFSSGASYMEMNIGTGLATITAAGGSLINGSPTSTTALALYPNQSAELICDTGGNWNAFLGGAPIPALVANQVLGSLTAVAPSGLNVPSCSGASNALTWTSGTGFGCNTIAGSGTINNGTSGQFSKYTGTNTLSGSTVWTDTGTVLSASEPMTVTANTAGSLTVGANGATNPVLAIDASTASVASGIVVKGAATGGPTTITATDSGSNSGITLLTKGTGALLLEAPSSGNATLYSVSGTSNLEVNGTNIVSATSAAVNITTNASSTAANPKFKYAQINDATLTAGTEALIEYWNNAAQSRGHATGAITNQRDFLINGATDTFVGASTVTNAATLALIPKSAGTNATYTNSSSLYIPTAAVTGTVTNAYGIYDVAPTGAGTLNLAAFFSGGIQMASLNTASTSETSALCLDSSNNVIADSVTCISSSGRFKNIVAPFTEGIDTVMALKPQRYKYTDEFLGRFKDDINHSHEQIGLIAENVAAVEPDLAVYEHDGVTPHGVRYDHVAVVAIEAIQEQQREIRLLFIWVSLLSLCVVILGIKVHRNAHR